MAPWEVTRVELSVEAGRVDVWADHPGRTRWTCPECGRELPTYDHAEEREWRHLDSCQSLTFLHARPPRVDCPDHGVRQIALPWAEPMSRFTMMFERLAIDVLKECNVEGARRLLRLSWDESWHLMERAVARGLRRKPARVIAVIGVDEKSVAKGQTYITVVSDLEQNTVEHIADERRQASLDSFFEQLTPEQREGIQAIAMDMWDPFLNSARAHLPEAESKVVFDRYHLMSHMGKAVDTVRKQENRALRAAGDQSLVGSKYLWLYSWENYALKENLRLLWEYNAPWGGAPLVEALVLLGNTLAPAAGDRGCPHAQAAPHRHPQLLPTSRDQRRRRGTQRADRHHPPAGARVPEPGQPQNRHLLPLRRARPLPRYPLNSRMSRLKAPVFSGRRGHSSVASVLIGPLGKAPDRGPCTYLNGSSTCGLNNKVTRSWATAIRPSSVNHTLAEVSPPKPASPGR